MANLPGRPRVVPSELIPELLQRRQQGESWGELARWLRNTCAVDVSRWTVRRVVLRLLPYKEGRA